MPIDALRKYGVVIAVTAIIAVAIVLGIFAFRNIIHIGFDLRTAVILVIAAAFLFAASRVFFSDSDRAVPVRYVVAFDAVVFVVLGSTATVLACSQWETGVLLGGSSLMIGGFVGLLFGYPQGIAQQAATQSSGQSNAAGGAAGAAQPANQGQGAADAAGAQAGPTPVPAPAPVPAHAQNLVAESAATLGKVIAGFTLAKVQGMGEYFSHLTNQIGPALGAANPAMASVLAGVIITYFGATGFLCGLFLPPYFMSEVI